MNKVSIDFNIQYYNKDYTSESYKYVHSYNRLIISNVKEVIYTNDYIKIYYTETSRSRTRKLTAIDLKYIKFMAIN